MNRDEAFTLLTAHTKGESLRKHALAVESAMREYAVKMGEAVEKWGIVGLLHDFDYEETPTPEEHPERGAVILREQGYPEDVIRAILSHADYLNIERITPMEKVLYAVDELAGFIVAVALVRPSKKIAEVKIKSVKKKMKDKAFARQVSREDIIKGAENLGVELDEHIQTVLTGMQKIAGDLGL